MTHGHGYGWGRAGDAGRLTLADMRHSAATEAGKRDPLGERLGLVAEARKAGHNRMIYSRTDGRRAFRLIHTDIAAVLPSGRILLQTGGWASMTTRRAMPEALGALGFPTNWGEGRGWRVVNVWGKMNGAANSLLLGRRDGENYQRKAIPFDDWISWETSRDGSVKLASVKRDTSAKIRDAA